MDNTVPSVMRRIAAHYEVLEKIGTSGRKAWQAYKKRCDVPMTIYQDGRRAEHDIAQEELDIAMTKHMEVLDNLFRDTSKDYE